MADEGDAIVKAAGCCVALGVAAVVAGVLWGWLGGEGERSSRVAQLEGCIVAEQLAFDVGADVQGATSDETVEDLLVVAEELRNGGDARAVRMAGDIEVTAEAVRVLPVSDRDDLLAPLVRSLHDYCSAP